MTEIVGTHQTTSHKPLAARFWLCETNGGQILRGHVDQCRFFRRRGRDNSPDPRCRGPFQSRLETSAAAERFALPFHWCKTCQQTGDLPKLAELNAQLDQAKADYYAALRALVEGDKPSRDLLTASHRLEKSLRLYLQFLRKNSESRADRLVPGVKSISVPTE